MVLAFIQASGSEMDRATYARLAVPLVFVVYLSRARRRGPVCLFDFPAIPKPCINPSINALLKGSLGGAGMAWGWE